MPRRRGDRGSRFQGFVSIEAKDDAVFAIPKEFLTDRRAADLLAVYENQCAGGIGFNGHDSLDTAGGEKTECDCEPTIAVEHFEKYRRCGEGYKRAGLRVGSSLFGNRSDKEAMGFDALVANAGRLNILTALAVEERQEFVQLRQRTAVTDGNLACHARRLATAGLIEINKSFRDGKPVTSITLTTAGRSALEAHARRVLAAISHRRIMIPPPAGSATR